MGCRAKNRWGAPMRASGSVHTVAPANRNNSESDVASHRATSALLLSARWQKLAMGPLHMTFCYQSRHAHLSPATLNHCFTQLEPFLLLPAHMQARTHTHGKKTKKTKTGVHFGLRQEQSGAVDLFSLTRTCLLLKSWASQVHKTSIDFFSFGLKNLSSPQDQQPLIGVDEKILDWFAILRGYKELMLIIV